MPNAEQERAQLAADLARDRQKLIDADARLKEAQAELGESLTAMADAVSEERGRLETCGAVADGELSHAWRQVYRRIDSLKSASELIDYLRRCIDDSERTLADEDLWIDPAATGRAG